VRCGPLRFVFEVQGPATVDDAYGQAVPGWTTLLTRRGALESAGTRERVVAEQLGMAVSHKVTLRGRLDLQARQRLVLGARVFNVVHVCDPDGRDRSREVLCLESRE
jgi:SPP1 family predicted phage head-tail adaptor